MSLVALLSLVVLGAHLSAGAVLVGLPAVVLQLLCFVLASRLAVAVYGLLLQVRSGAVLAALVNAFILAFTAQGWALIAAFVSTDVQGVMASGARVAPSGWGLVAVEAAGRGDWLEVLLALLLVALTGGPALVAALTLSWWGIPVGLATGVLAWWHFGKLAAARLEQRGPELLTLLRHGRATVGPGSKASTSDALAGLPRGRRYLVGFCLGFGAIPLIPQGIVPLVFKLNGAEVKSWFLAMRVPDPWPWPVIAAMIVLGLAMYTYGGLAYLRASRSKRLREDG